MAEKYRGKHKKKDLLKECPDHGLNATKQNIKGGLVICMTCKKPVL